MSDPENEQLIVIRAFNFQHEALVDKAKLDSAGIDCFLKNDNMEIIQPFFSQSTGGIKLKIYEKEAETALEILKDFPETTENTEEQEK